MPTAQPAKLPYCGADAATEELLPEPSQDALTPRRARAGKSDSYAMICATCSQPWPSAVGLLLPYHRRLNGSQQTDR